MSSFVGFNTTITANDLQRKEALTPHEIELEQSLLLIAGGKKAFSENTTSSSLSSVSGDYESIEEEEYETKSI